MDFYLGERTFGIAYQLLQKEAPSVKSFKVAIQIFSFQFYFGDLPCFGIFISNENLYLHSYLPPFC